MHWADAWQENGGSQAVESSLLQGLQGSGKNSVQVPVPGFIGGSEFLIVGSCRMLQG